MFLATAQSHIQEDPKLNSQEIQNLIRQAAQAGADFVHFPETALSGYVKTQIKSWSQVDWQLIEEELRCIGQLCEELGVWVGLGCNHNNPDMERPFNSLYTISPSGHIEARYDKRFCSNSEISDWYCAGTVPVIVDVKGIRLGFALCIEIQFPELYLEYETLEVDCVVYSAYSDSEMFKIQAQGHAACNNFWLSFSVPTNTSCKQSSCFIGPDGLIIGSCENGVSGFIMHEINPNAKAWDVPYNKARPWRKLARQGNIYKPYQHKKREPNF